MSADPIRPEDEAGEGGRKGSDGMMGPGGGGRGMGREGTSCFDAGTRGWYEGGREGGREGGAREGGIMRSDASSRGG